MEIDILISSCSRPDVLERTILSFKKNIYSNKHKFKYILIEDKVDDINRQELGKKWINKNIKLFDEVYFLKEKAGVGFWWQEALKKCNTDFHFHLEDDNYFIKKIYIDHIVEMMIKYNDIVEVMLSRGKIRKINNLGEININGIYLTNFRLFSVATGLFNTKNVYDILDYLGWKNKIHENGTLTPASEKLGFRKLVLGHNEKHYDHIGAIENYRKGAWK